jgi:hypothetical protein
MERMSGAPRKYDLTLIVSDERGTTRVKYSGAKRDAFDAPILAALLNMHEQFMPDEPEPEEPRR